MTPEQRFCAYLDGFSELQPTPPTAAQWNTIRERLQQALGHQPHQPTTPLDAHHQPGTVVAGPITTHSAHENPAPVLAF
jgi:hypothetical protein